MSVFDDIRAEGIVLDPFREMILRASGARTAEDLHSLLSAFPSLSVSFGIPSARITGTLGPTFSAAYARSIGQPPPPAPALGAVPPPGTLHGVGTVAGLPARPSMTITVGAAGAAIDHRLPNWPVRNQEQRGTCVAFGAAAGVEHHRSAAGPGTPDYSEQFLYHRIKTASRDPHPNTDGTWLEFAGDMLAAHGICAEPLHPYDRPGPINPVSGAAPSARAVADAKGRIGRPSTYQRRPGSPAAIILSLLQNGGPVAASLPVFEDPTTLANNWTTRVGWLYGRVFDPPIQSVANGGHCVCITGFQPDPAEPTGGYFVFRNSWGPAWSANSPVPGQSHAPEPGYGEISATYVDNYCWELLQM